MRRVSLAVVLAVVACQRRDLEHEQALREANDKAEEAELAKAKAAKPKPKPKPAVFPESPWVSKLAPLAKNPRAAKPKSTVANYMQTGRDRFFFDVQPVGEVEVSIVASKPARWYVSVAKDSARVADFAPSDGIEELARDQGMKGTSWHKITGGSFAGSFLFQSLGTLEVHSLENLCEEFKSAPHSARKDCP